MGGKPQMMAALPACLSSFSTLKKKQRRMAAPGEALDADKKSMPYIYDHWTSGGISAKSRTPWEDITYVVNLHTYTLGKMGM